jgi:L-ribulose-5-phosphate 3-epimerase
MNPIGIMQGRLSPAGARAQAFPHGTWREEFRQARELGFDRIEWLVDAASLRDNPLLHDVGQVLAISRDTGVGVDTVCADCFIEHPFANADAAALHVSVALLDRLIVQSAAIGARTIIVPLLEGNAVADRDHCERVLTQLADVAMRAGRVGIRIAIESDLPAGEWDHAIKTGHIGVCYDLGNAVAAGQDLVTAIEMLGERIIAVHVKDRPVGGASVALGNGDVDFASAFAGLKATGYAGPLILETPRGSSPVDAARSHLAFVRQLTATAAFVA